MAVSISLETCAIVSSPLYEDKCVNRKYDQSTRYTFACVFAVVLALITVTALTFGKRSERMRFVASSQPRTLIVLVPGTFAKNTDWIDAGSTKETFAKVLRRSRPAGDRIISFRWSGKFSHEARVLAAKELAKTINEQNDEFDRVAIVGHSYGGSIATKSADYVDREIDLIICLGTPHVYIRHATMGGDYSLPVYVSPDGLKNTRRLITIDDSGDRVVEEWSNALLTGITEQEAIESTSGWRDTLGSKARSVRPAAIIPRLFESGQIFASRKLVVADDQIQIDSRDARPLGISAHLSLHNPSMGKVIDRLIDADQMGSRQVRHRLIDR